MKHKTLRLKLFMISAGIYISARLCRPFLLMIFRSADLDHLQALGITYFLLVQQSVFLRNSDTEYLELKHMDRDGAFYGSNAYQ